MKDDDLFISHSVEETIAFGRQFARDLEAGDVVALQGGLGAGKTHFVKGIAEAFGIDQALVHSPTFSIINEYEGSLPICHFDCYRLKSVREAEEIGAEEYFYDDAGICLIEWPERIESLLPFNTHRIYFKISGLNKREIYIA
jgi:tRNA threonylcarbamoyladenosine biosynthesis protein TsaE